eukprot:1468016-Pyramimonas_sp.AAC.1
MEDFFQVRGKAVPNKEGELVTKTSRARHGARPGTGEQAGALRGAPGFHAFPRQPASRGTPQSERASHNH